MQLKLDPQWKTLVVFPYSNSHSDAMLEYFLCTEPWDRNDTTENNLDAIADCFHRAVMPCKLTNCVFDKSCLPPKKGIYAITRSGFVLVSSNVEYIDE